MDIYSSSGRFHFHHQRRRVVGTLSFHRILHMLLWGSLFSCIFVWQRSAVNVLRLYRQGPPRPPPPPSSLQRSFRPVVFNLTDFGGVGDGVTLNTMAFERAVEAISKFSERGGGQLNVQRGVWLTAPFNLTSHMTLFLAEGAVILGIEDEKYWPLMPPLPSYGYGREKKGPRYGSLIHGQYLEDVVITEKFLTSTSFPKDQKNKQLVALELIPARINFVESHNFVPPGHNGTIDGKGKTWWSKFQQKLLKHTRGPLVQIMWSRDVVISNITLRDPPFWTLHPYDCKNVTISNVTILAPLYNAPNTDGIDPDSCEDMIIENCYIHVGDDGIAIKSGWDQYGIAYGRPSTNILIRNVVLRTIVSAGVSIGSEMSGGISKITLENILVWNSRRGVRIKTAPGRGGYIRDISYRNLTFDNLGVGIVVKTDYNEHPDDGFDPKAIPCVENISFHGIYGRDVRIPVRIQGSEEIPLRGISFRDMAVGVTKKKKRLFQCAYVWGRAIGKLSPAPCENLDLYDEQGRLVRRSTSQNATLIDYDI